MSETIPDPAVRPRLRPLEPIPVQHNGRPHVAWRDPVGISPPIEVPQPVAVLMTLLDGERSCDDVRARWRELAGEELPPEYLTKLTDELNELMLLDGPRFRAAREQEFEQFRGLGVRPPSHCPDAYPDRPDDLAQQLDELLERGRSLAGTLGTGPIRGLVAPHIDLTRGGNVYGAAYDALRRSTADLFIIMGIAHSSSCWPDPTPLVTLTRLDYDTPLGTCHTDRTFIDDLVERHRASGGDPADLFRDELVHRAEHSVEFQALFLQHLHGHREFRIVPLLGGSLHEFYNRPEELAGPDGLGPFLAALRGAIEGYDGEACLIAGADLSHVGPRFGGIQPVDEAQVDALAAGDEDALRRWAAEGPESFFAHFAADDNARNVCSVSNLYLLRALLPEAQPELLRYEVAFDPQQTVSFAGALLR